MTPVYKKEDSAKVKNNRLVSVLTIYSIKDLQMTDEKTNKGINQPIPSSFSLWLQKGI